MTEFYSFMSFSFAYSYIQLSPGAGKTFMGLIVAGEFNFIKKTQR